MSGLAVAIEQKQWTLASLYLLLGVCEAAEKLPPESLTALIDLLGGDETATEVRRRGHS
jgi:hypothetical protein